MLFDFSSGDWTNVRKVLSFATALQIESGTMLIFKARFANGNGVKLIFGAWFPIPNGVFPIRNG
jgi:hypothetical protein